MNLKYSKFKIAILLIITMSVIATLFVYPHLPEQVATHWNIDGDVDAYSNKSAVIWLSLLPLLIFIMMEVMPRIDPNRKNYEKHKTAYSVTMGFTILLLVIVNWASMLFALNFPVNIKMLINVMVGLLFIAIGNYMPQVRHNFFFGIKSPWCLSSENVWRKTHRMGGILFIISGILFLINGFTSSRLLSYLTIAMIIAISFGLYVYSYILFKREN